MNIFISFWQEISKILMAMKCDPQGVATGIACLYALTSAPTTSDKTAKYVYRISLICISYVLPSYLSPTYYEFIVFLKK